ncbi:MAG TPA: SAM-dependent methyltransferase [Thermoanaerobaculia bacterium]|nr:SAM-dependent methyltransferase [Thermoanaerobaculia bacterium]
MAFRDFVELALYHPVFGYYARPKSPIGREGDFITSPLLSPLFSDVLGNLINEFMSRAGDGVSQVVDIGCGDGELIRLLAGVGSRGSGVGEGFDPLCDSAHDVEAGKKPSRSPDFAPTPEPRLPTPTFYGFDRSLGRTVPDPRVTYVSSLAEILPADARLIISNELFDALPFARLVQRDEHLHELWVTERDGALDWSEHEADGRYEDYFAERGIVLEPGQFADVSLEWSALYDELCRFVPRGLIVTFDYGLPQSKLFRGRMRRFGTAAAYSGQRVSRDLLANPGEQDLTAHINFDDLIRTGESQGLRTLFFDMQAKFLLAQGAADHPLLAPVENANIGSAEEGIALLDAREDAKRLILPDGIGAEIRVLVQERGMGQDRWRFQTKLF